MRKLADIWWKYNIDHEGIDIIFYLLKMHMPVQEIITFYRQYHMAWKIYFYSVELNSFWETWKKKRNLIDMIENVVL